MTKYSLHSSLSANVALASFVWLHRYITYRAAFMHFGDTSFTQVIPFVAGGFMYIGAVAVLPTYADYSP